MSPNKDETGRRIVSDAVVVDLAVKFIVYYRWHKTSQQRFCRDYACPMSPNKDETGRRLSRMLLLLVVW